MELISSSVSALLLADRSLRVRSNCFNSILKVRVQSVAQRWGTRDENFHSRLIFVVCLGDIEPSRGE